MTTFLVKRLLWSIPTLIGVTILTFSLIHIAPGGPAQALGSEKATPAQVPRLAFSTRLARITLPAYPR